MNLKHMDQNQYIAGVCNIGPKEIARRRNFGWGGLAIVIVLLVVLIRTGVNPWWRLFDFFPAALAASGFLQAYFHFCSGFAKQGIFNFDSLGQTQNVTDDTSRQKDRQKGNQITLYAVLIGLAIAIVSVIF